MRKTRRSASSPKGRKTAKSTPKKSARGMVRKKFKHSSKSPKATKSRKPSGSSLSALKKELAQAKRELTKLRKSKKFEESNIVELTKKQAKKASIDLRRQKLTEIHRKAAKKAATAFRPNKKDRGQYVFIGVKGTKPQKGKGKKSAKGYLVFVDKAGKKHLVEQHTNEFPYRARTRAEIQVPLEKGKLAQAKRFQASKRKTKPGTKNGWNNKKIKAYSYANPVEQGYVRSKGDIKTGGVNDFNDKAVKALTKSIHKALQGQESHRIFIVRTMVLVRLPDGEEKVFDFNVDIQKADHIIIKLTGVEHFVKQRFYAFMARELSFMGYVSSGSANHIRSLKENKGKPESKWKDSRGEPWAGRNKEIANILVLEWKIEQAE